MSAETSIEWCDATWNPVRGCSRVSAGCVNCYAELVAARFSDPGAPFAGFAKRVGGERRWTGRVELVPEALDWPLRVRRPAWVRQAEAEGRRPRIFVNSMSDLFHERLSDEQIAAVFGVMATKPEWDFLVLTKRPDRLRRWFDGGPGSREKAENYCLELARVFGAEAGLTITSDRECLQPRWPLPNVWLGTSVEDQATADERIPHLLATPAAIRFVSYEPALGPVDFRYFQPFALELANLPGVGNELDWLIVGGESGPGARPFDLAWARSTVEQCRSAKVPVFVKQLGAQPTRDVEVKVLQSGGISHEERVVTEKLEAVTLRLRDRKGGDTSEWPEDLRVREWPVTRETRP